MRKLYKKDLDTSLLIGYQPIGFGYGKCTGAESLYDWKYSAQFAKLPGAGTNGIDKFNIGLLMCQGGIGEQTSASVRSAAGIPPNLLKAAQTVATDFEIVSWQSALLKENFQL